MRTSTTLAVAACFALMGVVAPAQTPSFAGYLGPDRAPEMVKILPPVPSDGSPQDLADRAIFRSTRALKGSPRWVMAKNDVDTTIPAMLRDFSCAAGVALTEANAPRLRALLIKMSVDLRPAVDGPKVFFQRKRPFQVDEGDVCVENTQSLAGSADYPSGHATWAWAIGLILAEIEPSRATQVLNRARAFGESRVVCGVHNASAVSAGRTDGAALIAALHGDAVFRSDLDAARTEMTGHRGAPAPGVEMCEAEAAVTAQAPW